MGDIFFIQKIIDVLSENGTVYHPISDHLWDKGPDRLINKAISGPQSQMSIPSDASHINLSISIADSSQTMRVKYDHLDIDYSDWKDYLKYNRDTDGEKRLSDMLEIDGPFILVNRFYGLGGDIKTMDGPELEIPENYDGKIVRMNPYMTANIFDWCGLFEKAEQIHTVDTSILFVLQTLDLQATRMTVHPRHYLRTKPAVQDLFDKPWEWIDYDRDKWRELTPLEGE
jgi:hypothetical protein